MNFIRMYQLDIMMVLSSICGLMAVLVFITKPLSRKRKFTMLLMEGGAMVLLMADMEAYIFRGDVSRLGYWMVRISNFLVFSLTLLVIYGFNMYLVDLYTHEGGMEKAPKRLALAKAGFVIGELLIIVSQFTGLYYTFDATNHYQRSHWFIICYVIPMAILCLQLSVVVQYRKKLSRTVVISLFLFTIFPLVASLAQVFLYGISLTNITIVGLAVVLYILALLDMNETVERANKLEIKYLKEKNQEANIQFEQTVKALAHAIDAKDQYTHGHSSRVADYSRRIAERSGKSVEECQKIYYAALLHDVGKIGVPDRILNKEGKLTLEEFSAIKQHPKMGEEILESIKQSPWLGIGAHYHHERYDGKGYPDGLKGEEIPDIARIIAVADAYDAMTSKRSYRSVMPQEKVRQQIELGIGTQFDPEYAKIMLDMIDQDPNYQMRETSRGDEETGGILQ